MIRQTRVCCFDMIESGCCWRRRVVSIIVDIRNVAIVIDSELCGLQLTEGIGKVSRISVNVHNFG